MNRRKFVRLSASAPFLAAATDVKASAGESFIALPGSARVYEIGHGEARILVGSEQSAGSWWLAQLSSEPGRKTSLHVHFHADEQFYVLEGTLSVWLEDRWNELPVGSVAAVTHGISHALGNRSQQPVRFLAAGSPAGFEGYFADIEVLARRLPYASPEFLTELKKIYRKYDSELLGPPPEG